MEPQVLSLMQNRQGNTGSTRRLSSLKARGNQAYLGLLAVPSPKCRAYFLWTEATKSLAVPQQSTCLLLP